jgi:hypothetical protein
VRRGLCAAVLALSLFGSAHGAPTLFTFDDGALASGDGDIRVSLYMTVRHPPWVVVNGSQVHSGDGFGDDLYLWTRGQLLHPGDIQILLGDPVAEVAFDWYVFDATEGADFTFVAYDGRGNIVHQATWDAGVDGTGGTYSTGPLGVPVYRLVFSDNHRHDIGIDNLSLMPVPVPGAILLGVLGASLISMVRPGRRFRR